MINRSNKISLLYSVATIFITFVIGEIILLTFPEKPNIFSSILFIIMNLVPMVVAYFFSKINHEIDGVFDFLKQVFFQKETIFPYIGALVVVIIFYGLSFMLGNVNYTNASILTLLSYFPWTILQGGIRGSRVEVLSAVTFGYKGQLYNENDYCINHLVRMAFTYIQTSVDYSCIF